MIKMLVLTATPKETFDLFDKKDINYKFKRILDYIGVSGGELAITNCVANNPPNDRDVLTEEIDTARKGLFDSIVKMDPKVIVSFNKIGYTMLTSQEVGGPFKLLFNKTFHSNILGKSYPVIYTYCPQYLLRRQSANREVLPHWNMVKEMVNHDSA